LDKTVESYHPAIEDEMRGWNDFAKALRKEDREAFDILMEVYRNYASTRNNATQLLHFEPMIMSMLISQQIRLRKLEKELDGIRQKQHTSSQLR
jgi:hypothetical protein